jgi:hypothetical protein
MLVIKTEVKPSKIHGLGLFTLEDLKKGQALWKKHPIIDMTIAVRVIESLPELTREMMYRYTWRDKKGNFLISLDNDKFMNHSEDPNTDGDNAIRDIKAGEELTSCYEMTEPEEYEAMKIPMPKKKRPGEHTTAIFVSFLLGGILLFIVVMNLV